MCAEICLSLTVTFTLALAITTPQSPTRELISRKWITAKLTILISFPREEKKTRIEKTYAPGPGSYNNHSTVGVV